ncbi:MAG: hypothetical protein R3D67_04725 [Hyphomicrobiaceae bacterium]
MWGVSGQYDFVRERFDGGVNVPRIPPHLFGAGVNYRDPNWLARVFTLATLRQDAVSIIDSRDTSTNGYTPLKAELAYTAKIEDDVRNHVSFKKDEVLQHGRAIRLCGLDQAQLSKRLASVTDAIARRTLSAGRQ